MADIGIFGHTHALPDIKYPISNSTDPDLAEWLVNASQHVGRNWNTDDDGNKLSDWRFPSREHGYGSIETMIPRDFSTPYKRRVIKAFGLAIRNMRNFPSWAVGAAIVRMPRKQNIVGQSIVVNNVAYQGIPSMFTGTRIKDQDSSGTKTSGNKTDAAKGPEWIRNWGYTGGLFYNTDSSGNLDEIQADKNPDFRTNRGNYDYGGEEDYIGAAVLSLGTPKHLTAMCFVGVTAGGGYNIYSSKPWTQGHRINFWYVTHRNMGHNNTPNPDFKYPDRYYEPYCYGLNVYPLEYLAQWNNNTIDQIKLDGSEYLRPIDAVNLTVCNVHRKNGTFISTEATQGHYALLHEQLVNVFTPHYPGSYYYCRGIDLSNLSCVSKYPYRQWREMHWDSNYLQFSWAPDVTRVGIAPPWTNADINIRNQDYWIQVINGHRLGQGHQPVVLDGSPISEKSYLSGSTLGVVSSTPDILPNKIVRYDNIIKLNNHNALVDNQVKNLLNNSGKIKIQSVIPMFAEPNQRAIYLTTKRDTQRHLVPPYQGDVVTGSPSLNASYYPLYKTWYERAFGAYRFQNQQWFDAWNLSTGLGSVQSNLNSNASDYRTVGCTNVILDYINELNNNFQQRYSLPWQTDNWIYNRWAIRPGRCLPMYIVNIERGLSGDRYGQIDQTCEFIFTGAYSAVNPDAIDDHVDFDVWGGDCYITRAIVKVRDNATLKKKHSLKAMFAIDQFDWVKGNYSGAIGPTWDISVDEDSGVKIWNDDAKIESYQYSYFWIVGGGITTPKAGIQQWCNKPSNIQNLVEILDYWVESTVNGHYITHGSNVYPLGIKTFDNNNKGSVLDANGFAGVDGTLNGDFDEDYTFPASMSLDYYRAPWLYFYNFGYSIENIYKKFVSINSSVKRHPVLDSRICWSKQKIYNTNSTGFDEWLPLDYYDLPEKYGGITAIRKINSSNLVTIHRLGVTVQTLGQVQAYDPNGKTVTLTSGQVIGSSRDVNIEYGSRHLYTVRKADNIVYFFDSRVPALCIFSEGRVQDASNNIVQSGLVELFGNYNDLADSDIRGYVDVLTRRYGLVNRVKNGGVNGVGYGPPYPDKTVMLLRPNGIDYRHDIRFFESFRTWNGSFVDVIGSGAKSFGISSASSQQGSTTGIWAFDNDNTSQQFGIGTYSSVTILVNQYNNHPKRFDSVRVLGKNIQHGVTSPTSLHTYINARLDNTDWTEVLSATLISFTKTREGYYLANRFRDDITNRRLVGNNLEITMVIGYNPNVGAGMNSEIVTVQIINPVAEFSYRYK
jgi:hypothetical protein